MLIFIQSLIQKNNDTFCIVWSDKRSSELNAKTLQKNCPCARCQDKKGEVSEEVRPLKISSVGNYALRIDFTKGCSRGVFTFDLLRTLDLREDV